MANGKKHDNPLTDLLHYGQHPFPPDIETLLVEVVDLAQRSGWDPLLSYWPFTPREFAWEAGQDLEGAIRDLSDLLVRLKEGRGEEVLGKQVPEWRPERS